MPTRLPQARVVPDGLSYREGFLSGEEEHGLLAEVEAIDFRAFVMRGQAARRTVRHFGWGYSFDERELVPADPLPEALAWLRKRAEALAGLQAGAFEQALVTRYPPGATIGWHRDAPPFGAAIVGVSLAAACRMRFQRPLDGVRYVHEQVLEPRSAYVLAGAARSAWQHSIPPTKALRYSITFRTLKGRVGVG
jgi:alkylated DNA repair protein (DNA oxidative demethylase)